MDQEQMEEIKRHFGVVAEGLRHEVQLVAEGVVNLNERLDRDMVSLRSDNEKIDRSIMSLQSDVMSLQSDVTFLRSDVTSLQSDVTSLQDDVTSLRSDNEKAHQDILSAIKISNAEIEGEMHGLQSRVDRLEVERH